MSSFIGIAHPGYYHPSKRDALLFDQIGMIGFSPAPGDNNSPTRVENEWLAQHGVVYPAEPLALVKEFPKQALPLAEAAYVQMIIGEALTHIALNPSAVTRYASQGKLKKLLQSSAVPLKNVDDGEVARKAHYRLSALVQSRKDVAAAAAEALIDCTQRVARVTALLHRDVLGVDVVPISLSSLADPKVGLGDRTGTVVEIILKQMPMPDETTPWEKIIDFRNDEFASRARRRLRRWIRKAAENSASPANIADDLQELIEQYDDHMNVHKIKISRGVLRTVITSIANVAEDLVHLRFSNMVSAFFSATDRKIALLEAELSAPGREVAYLSLARSTFIESGA